MYHIPIVYCVRIVTVDDAVTILSLSLYHKHYSLFATDEITKSKHKHNAQRQSRSTRQKGKSSQTLGASTLNLLSTYLASGKQNFKSFKHPRKFCKNVVFSPTLHINTVAHTVRVLSTFPFLGYNVDDDDWMAGCLVGSLQLHIVWSFLWSAVFHACTSSSPLCKRTLMGFMAAIRDIIWNVIYELIFLIRLCTLEI